PAPAAPESRRAPPGPPARSFLPCLPSLLSTPLDRETRRAFLGTHRTEDADGSEHAPLVDPDPLQANQLQQGQEGHDHRALRLQRLEQLRELERLALPDEGQQLFHARLDALPLRLHLV